MSNGGPALLRGEYERIYDDRYRVQLPPEIAEFLGGESAECVLTKEMDGCLSLWPMQTWRERFEVGVEVLSQKLRMNAFQGEQFAKLQRLGRLLSTRSRTVQLGQRGRVLVPEGFREFLGAEPGTPVIVVGCGVCAEIWTPNAWVQYVRSDVGTFSSLFQELVLGSKP